jgi:hypothetical protein
MENPGTDVEDEGYHTEENAYDVDKVVPIAISVTSPTGSKAALLIGLKSAAERLSDAGFRRRVASGGGEGVN